MYWIVTLNTRDGEREYGDMLLVKTLTMSAAEKKVKRLYLADPKFDKWKDNKLNLYEIIIELNSIQEVPREDYKVLKKYLYEV